MKTNMIANYPASFHSPQGSSAPSVFAVACKLLLAVVCVSLVSFAAVPPAMAAAPNGQYKFVKATGSISANGETMELPQDVVNQIAAIKNGKITVQNSKVKLDRSMAAGIIKQLGKELGVTFDTKITGPTSVTLKKSGKSYVGATTKPVVVKFSTTYEGDKVSGTIKTKFRIKVTGNKMKMTVPLTANALGEKFEGQLVINLKK